MKTYTLEQIKKYILSQDSLGDVLYNLNKIDQFLINKEIIEITNEGELNDFLLDLEDNQGNSFSYNGEVYKISLDITSFIRDYRYDTFCQMCTSKNALDEMLQNGLIEFVEEL